MKSILRFIFILFIIYPAAVFPQQEEIVEKVAVEWWVIPVFAVDPAGKAVTDLQASDIQLKVDNKKIAAFELIRRSFTVSLPGSTEIKEPGTQEPAAVPPPAPPPVKRIKNIFLLFDTALSTKNSTEAARAIANKIVNSAEKNTRFFIMVIEPFAGLVYVGGQTNDKAALIDIIDKKVKGKSNSRTPSASEIIVDGEGKLDKYDETDYAFFRARASKYYKRKSKNFVQSFESLYYALNTIRDNKFVYLFTEGISNAVMETESGDRALYRKYLTQVAEFLGRSGAVLFIINPFGAVNPSDFQVSGEDSLRFLAQKSKGKYLEGSDKSIIEKIGNIHQAYYEIFFPAVPRTGTGVLEISVTPKRKDIDIHSLQAAEKSRSYDRMKPIEKEVLALNLISGNLLYKSGITPEKANISRVTKKKSKVTYRLEIPGRFVNRQMDLYKIWLTRSGSTARIEEQTIANVPRKMKIPFKNVLPGNQTYFVLIDTQQKTALVHGMKKEESQVFRLNPAQEEPAAQEWATGKAMEKERRADNPAEKQELERLLKGAAGYCEKLKDAAFHYICKEKILENQEPLTQSSTLSRDTAINPVDPLFTKPIGWISREEIKSPRIAKNEFNYRLIKMGKNVKEERELAGGDGKEAKEGKQQQALTTSRALEGIRFVSGKAVFGPITLLAAERQGKYHFRLLGNKQLKGRPTAVIEAFPRDEKDSQYVYGKLWIDSEDFSVLKIEVNPNSILGYEKLRGLADEMNTRLLLTLETEFFKLRQGIRFPTRIYFDETYKGGPFITGRRGSRGWNRTKTITVYTDYMFFGVETDVTYK